MSRVAKKPIVLPKGVEVKLDADGVTVKGAKGALSTHNLPGVVVVVSDGVISVQCADGVEETKFAGTARALLANMVKGVSEGFTVNLEINGVGYRAAVQGKALQLQLGFSHDVNFPIPEDVSIKCEKPTSISITGKDSQRVGQVAAEIRAYRGPEPYKGKGVKYETETILRKEGKKK